MSCCLRCGWFSPSVMGSQPADMALTCITLQKCCQGVGHLPFLFRYSLEMESAGRNNGTASEHPGAGGAPGRFTEANRARE